MRFPATAVRTALVATALSSMGVIVLAGGFQGQQPPPTTQGRGATPPQGGQARDAAVVPVGTASISGIVVTEGSGAPVRRARVNLSGAELRGARSAVTADDGRFTFTNLPAGRYTMTASKPGYVNISYGAKRAGRPGTPIQLIEGQRLEKAVMNLPKGGVITGIVIDETGEPAPQTSVRVMRVVMQTGEKTLQQAGSDTTDDRGMYRIFSLQPGDYIVNATPRNQGLGDLAQTLRAEMEGLMQQLAALGGADGRGGGRGGGAGAGGGGGGGAGGRGGGRGMNIEVPNMLGGRGGDIANRLAQVQQQLQQTEEQTVAYAPVFFPGTTMPSGASTVALAVGEERGGVDFQLQLVQTARIEGTVSSPDGVLPPNIQVGLLPHDPGGLPNIPGIGTAMSRVNNNGQFQFSGVAPGQYRLVARAAVRQDQPASAQPAQPAAAGRGGVDPGQFQGRGGRGGGPIVQVLWASTDISIGGQNIRDLVLGLQPGMTVRGQVQFDGVLATPPADLARLRVNLMPRGQQMFDMGGGAPPVQVDPTGRFTITGVVPGRYSLSANAPNNQPNRGGQPQPAPQRGQGAATPSWRLKSAMAGGRDVLDFPLVIEPNQEVGGLLLTFTDRTQEVTGTIQDPTGRPTSDFTIIIFPTDSRYWVPQSRRILSARPSTDGKFTLANLPVGEYRLTAVTDVEPGEWYNPDFLQQLMGASIGVSLRDGEKKVQDIRVAGGGGF